MAAMELNVSSHRPWIIALLLCVVTSQKCSGRRMWDFIYNDFRFHTVRTTACPWPWSSDTYVSRDNRVTIVWHVSGGKICIRADQMFTHQGVATMLLQIKRKNLDHTFPAISAWINLRYNLLKGPSSPQYLTFILPMTHCVCCPRGQWWIRHASYTSHPLHPSRHGVDLKITST